MKWVRAILGLGVIGGVVYGAYAWKENRLPVELPAMLKPAPVVHAALEEGADVPLLLLTPLTSGGSKVGDEVKLVVRDNVKSKDGHTVIAQGTLVEGKVARSRGGTVASALGNQPARLVVELGSVQTVDGQKLALSSGQGEGQAEYEFTASNTRLDQDTADIQALVNDPEARDYLLALVKGETPQGKEPDQKLKKIAEKHGLGRTEKLIQKQGRNEGSGTWADAIKGLQSGNVGSLAGVDLVLAAQAAGEIGDLVGSVDKTLRGTFKGSNIKASVGTTVHAKVADDATVTIREKS
ncbi:MAG: hypothetical protein KIT11_02345 [Fimbriimonadaceae bacterium]|nr:hypothetical protein [Fimbriimonadaceae bacterium]QYK54791.1 MAG: hypothetical protein KF733_07190 [Fimbriimonadaceae bacterium]